MFEWSRTSHWKYSRCLLGNIFSWGIAWRVAEVTKVWLEFLSQLQGEICIVVWIHCHLIPAAPVGGETWRRLVPVAGPSAHSPPRTRAPPERWGSSADCSPHPPRAILLMPPSSQQLSQHRFHIDWWSLEITEEQQIMVCGAFICHWVSFSLFQSPATKWGGKRKGQRPWGREWIHSVCG